MKNLHKIIICESQVKRLLSTCFLLVVILTQASEVFVESNQAGGAWRLIHESINIDLPAIEPQSSTNLETGAVLTSGRPPGISRREFYIPVSDTGGISKTNKNLALSMVGSSTKPRIIVRGFLIESNSAVFLCDSYYFARVTGQPDLMVMIVTPPSGTNSAPKITGQTLWNAQFGEQGMLKKVRMSGSLEDGTLKIETESIVGEYLVKDKFSFNSGKWLIEKSKQFNRGPTPKKVENNE